MHHVLAPTTIPAGFFRLAVVTIPGFGRGFLSRRGGKCLGVVTFFTFLVRIVVTTSAKLVEVYFVVATRVALFDSAAAWHI